MTMSVYKIYIAPVTHKKKYKILLLFKGFAESEGLI